MTTDEDKADLAKKAWSLMFGYLLETNPERSQVLSSRDLTPNDSRALWHLDQYEERPIGSLARDWGCDPSNATFIVNRLTRAGLAERRSDPNDGRVKLVVLTEMGARLRRELLEEFQVPPASMCELPKADLTRLIDILRKLPRIKE